MWESEEGESSVVAAVVADTFLIGVTLFTIWSMAQREASMRGVTAREANADRWWRTRISGRRWQCDR